MKLTCKTCGDIKVAHINGYDFGDKLLEDVLFEVGINTKGTKLEVIGVDPSSQEYFQNLNIQKWTREAKDYLKAIVDDGEIPLNCASCGDEATYDGYVGLGAGVPIQTSNATDFFKNIADAAVAARSNKK